MSVQTITLAPALAPRATPRARTDAPAGFALDTLVRTVWGLRPVKSLMAGDLLLDAAGKMVELRGLRRLRVAASDLVQVDPSALGLGVTLGDLSRPLIVGAGQRLAIRDWRTDVLFGSAALTQAQALVDGVHVHRRATAARVLCVLDFDRPVTLDVHGVLTRV